MKGHLKGSKDVCAPKLSPHNYARVLAGRYHNHVYL